MKADIDVKHFCQSKIKYTSPNYRKISLLNEYKVELKTLLEILEPISVA